MRYFIRIQINVFIMLIFILQLLTIHGAQSQIIDKTTLEKLKNADRSEFRYIPKKPGHYTPEEWRAAIDSTWGQGMSTANKLQLFNYSWNLIDDEYPSFFNIDDQWNSLYSAYYDTINASVSRGRFSAIMSRMFSSLTDMHSLGVDVPVSRDTLKPGTPLFVPAGVVSMYPRMFHESNYCHFGASLAPLPDSTVFVYNVVANHPLGLERGDIILGYDNIPWKQLYKELLAAELPIYGFGTFGSNPSSVIHGLLTSAGENWHLFDIIDILKYSTGDTVHLPTSLLINQQMQLLSSEQLPVPGVPFPDIDNGHHVSWGIVDGTQTGYIYTWSWMRSVDYPPPSYNAGDEFLQALQILINDYQIDGLIIDSRFNNGGFTYQYMQCLSVLFNEDQFTFSEWIRDDPNDHYSMKRANRDITGFTSSQYLFDLPIAMLTGPHSASCGDFMPLQMREHPMVRTFGLGTNGAFGHVEHQNLNPVFSDWDLYTTDSNFTYANQPGQYLTHLNIPPDEEIWFTQTDAVNHDDTVVKRALQWIGEMIYAHNVNPGSNFYQSHHDTFTITANVSNPDNHNINVAALINTLDSVLVDSVSMFDDGNHGDSLAGDGLYGGYVNPLMTEDIFTISASTTDLDSAHYHILPRVTRFTTIGPVVLDNYKITSSDTIPHHLDNLKFEFTLRNDGLSATATNITSQVIALDTFSTIYPLVTLQYGNIQPGTAMVSPNKQYIRFDIDPFDTMTVKFRINIFSNDVLFWSDTFSVVNVINGLEQISNTYPQKFYLSQNYPNPFNPTTTIEFSIPKSEFVTLKIYNLLGQEVSELVAKRLTPGNYKYAWDASEYSSGVYFYKLEARHPSTGSGHGFIQTKKLIFLK